MLSFTICLIALIVGYFTYGRLVRRIMEPDDRPTPALQHPDGVDYVPLPQWRMFMIQFLNIAGLGPIFGAIAGAYYGESAFLWIVLGSIFAGGVHDFTAAMLCLRHDGESLPETVARYLGKTAGRVMRIFSVLLLILVCANFVANPADLINTLTGGTLGVVAWICIIFAYYVLAALLPIDRVIAKIYPLFAAALIFMALGLLVVLYCKMPSRALLPEFWDGLSNAHPEAATHPLFPMLFVSIACGAISGFHSTQSPMMCRCMTSERQAFPVVYGAMILEGIVALIWAAATIWFIHAVPQMAGCSAAVVVNYISTHWLGAAGGLLAILGVVAAPITSGDTALRSARLIVADMLHIKQDTLRGRLPLSLVIFALTFALLIYAVRDAQGFSVLWRYFAWSNQTLACFALWTVTAYLLLRRRERAASGVPQSRLASYAYLITLLPALFMTAVCIVYIAIAPEGFGSFWT